MMRVLLLAGSGEARRIAPYLRALPGVDAQASLAGATRKPRDLGIATRVGGFGGDAGGHWHHHMRVHPFIGVQRQGQAVVQPFGL